MIRFATGIKVYIHQSTRHDRSFHQIYSHLSPIGRTHVIFWRGPLAGSRQSDQNARTSFARRRWRVLIFSTGDQQM
jgi:hypothetical protein